MNKLTITSTNHPLPFEHLSPADFERLCLWLVGREGYQRAEHYGEAGGDEGRDVIAYKIADNGVLQPWYFQCKRYKKISAKTLKEEVDKMSRLTAIERPHCIVFVTNASISARARKEVGEYCQSAGYKCEFWARTELDERVKKLRDVVDEFFDARSTMPPTSYNALHQLPSPPRDFTGRVAELDQVIDMLQGGVTISGVHGMGGIGKTSLALKVAEMIKDRYPDAQFFLDLRGVSDKPLRPARAMEHVIHTYQPMAKLPEDEDELRAIYLSVLNNQRALIIWDNARDAEQVAKLVPPPTCLMIVTSRERFALPGMQKVNLDVMRIEEARDLLLAIAPRIDGEASVIAELCGQLPLALRASASYLQEHEDESPADYANRLGDEILQLKAIQAEGVKISVEASFNLSYKRLKPETARVFQGLSIFPGSFDAAAEESVCSDAGHLHLRTLTRLSLVLFNQQLRRYKLHDLARVFTAAKLQAETSVVANNCNIFERRHAQYFVQVLRATKAAYEQGGESIKVGLQLFDRERANIEVGQAWAERNSGNDDEVTGYCSDYPYFGWPLLVLRLPPRERVRWFEAGLVAARCFNRREAEGWHLGNLGLASYELGELQRAIELYEQHKKIACELGDRKGEAQALIYQGLAYANVGEVERAIILLDQGLKISFDIDDHQGKVYALNHLGVACIKLGLAPQAIEFHKQALNIARQTGVRRGEGFALNFLGVANAEMNETYRAIKFYEQGLSVALEIGDRLVEGDALWNMSLAFDKLGYRDKAMSYAENALKTYEQINASNTVKVRDQLLKWRGQ